MHVPDATLRRLKACQSTRASGRVRVAVSDVPVPTWPRRKRTAILSKVIDQGDIRPIRIADELAKARNFTRPSVPLNRCSNALQPPFRVRRIDSEAQKGLWALG